MSKKSLKRAILSSVLAFVLSFAMLVGTTYAWFTDSVSSTGNIIQSGTLKIDVLVKGGDLKTAELDAAGVEKDDAGYYSLKSAAGKGERAPIFNYHLWEPGYTDWANVKVVNTGTLALKYTMRIVASGTVSKLAEVIDVYYAPYEVARPAARGFDGLTKIGTLKDVLEGGAGVVINDYLLAGDDANYAPDFATIALHMQESAGNEYQDLEIGSYFELQIIAGQYTYEKDSFDEMYDEQAEFPVLSVDINGSASAAGFHASAAEEEDVVIEGTNATSVVPKETTIVSAEDESGPASVSNTIGELRRRISTERNVDSVTYDISYQYTTTTDGVSKTVDVTEFSSLVRNDLYIGEDLLIIKVTHSHGGSVTEMSEIAGADVEEEGYFYNHTTGILTVKTARYSEFAVYFLRKTPVRTVTVEPGEVTMDVGQTADVTSSVLPDDATYKTVTWTSSDPSAVSVSDTGVVTAIKAGVYTVTAEADGVSSSCSVNVFADAKIGETYYAFVGDAFAAAEDHDTIVLLRNTEAGIKIHGINDLTFDMNGYTLSAVPGAGVAFTLYDCDGVTLKNGTVNGQFRIGEHQRTIVKWKYADETPMYGYHPLAPAQNVTLENLTVSTSGNVFYFTNIEDDLTRANESNPYDQDLYGHYIYKTGYQTYEQSTYNRRDEVFTALEATDTVTITGGSYTGAAMTGKMYDINGVLYTDVLIVNGGTFSSDGIGRFVVPSKNLVGSSADLFTVSDTAPADYTGKVNNIYYTYVGGANAAILYSDFGETVYIKENADAVKYFGEDEQGESQKLTVVYEADGVAYTGGTPVNAVYSMMIEDADIENGHVFYAAFQPAAAVYATSRNGNWKTATKVGEYATLQDAFSALSNDYTVVILKDMTVGDETTYTYGGTNYKCAAGYATRSTIDFNGHMITYTGTGACIVSSQQTGYLYLKDSSGTNAGGITATKGYCFRKENAKSDYTYISGGTYIAQTKNALYLSGGTGITISGGVIRSNATNALTCGWKVTALTLSGGTFIAPSGKAPVAYNSKITISGGTFTAAPDSRMITSGKSAVDNGDGTWTVR